MEGGCAGLARELDATAAQALPVLPLDGSERGVDRAGDVVALVLALV